MTVSEFTVANSYAYNQSSTTRWLWSHTWRYKQYLLTGLCLFLVSQACFSAAPVFIGQAFEVVLQAGEERSILFLSLALLGVLVLDGASGLIASYSIEVIAKRLERDAREEMYISLLGKNQVFHDRQRVGDLMARATDDMHQLSTMIMPGMSLIYEAALAIIVPLTYIAFIHVELLLVPIGFVISYIFALRHYTSRLNPVTREQRAQYGHMNTGLEETISGIEIVKASTREIFERLKFRRNARRYRDLFVQQGEIEARYLPLLLFGITVGLTFLHAMLLYQQGQVTIAQIIAVMGLVNVLRFPTFISIFTFSLVQLGLASAERILQIIQAETELDENAAGYSADITGEIRFENVSFGYDDHLVLDDISFAVEPGKTVAIVGQTGSGKSTLTQLVNRTYDVSAGQILIDGVDVRDWNLTTLRSQISKIEQDIFLFSRTIAENVAFGAPGAGHARIEQAAREAQAHDFITSFIDGYQTKVGSRGVTLSGGQRQRLALARAFLSNPRILILDDSTSAIDSATEDEIQKAIYRARQGRTTLLITHRLSQIRWADIILVLDRGRLVAFGTHEELLHNSPHYRRIFARYDQTLSPDRSKDVREEH